MCENVAADNLKFTEYMKKALGLAEMAFDAGEVPVGAVVVWRDENGNESIVGQGMNYRENGRNALFHAELSAIDQACRTLGGWRLHRATLYVTLEPCVMCAGAIINARIERVVYGAADLRFGAFGGHVNLNAFGFNHRPEIVRGVLSEECSNLLKCFFENLRNRRNRNMS